MNKYDIFISYRRKGGGGTASQIKESLSILGYNCFLDVNSLKSGDFPTSFKEAIENCTDFLLVLSPGDLDERDDCNDWVRLEIQHALAFKKNIIPILLPNFSFPEKLPESINEIRLINALNLDPQFYDAFKEKLVKDFLHIKIPIIRRIYQSSLTKKSLPVLVALSVIILIAGSATFAWKYWTSDDNFPNTHSEQQTVADTIGYLSLNSMLANSALEYVDMALVESTLYYNDQTPYAKDGFNVAVQQSIDMIEQYNSQITDLSNGLRTQINATILPQDEISAQADFIRRELDAAVEMLEYIIILLNTKETVAVQTDSAYIELCFASNEFAKDALFYGLNSCLVAVKEEALSELLVEIIPEMTTLNKNRVWLDSAPEIVATIKKSENIYDESVSKFESTVGALNEFISLKDELAKVENELEEILLDAEDKFRPTSKDTFEELWGKMIKYNSLDLYDMVNECIDFISSIANTDELVEEIGEISANDIEILLPLIRTFYSSISQTGINYGALVGTYPDTPIEDQFYQYGDIIISINGTPTYGHSAVTEMMEDITGVYSAQVLRLNEGELEAVNIEVDSQKDGKKNLYKLSEENS